MINHGIKIREEATALTAPVTGDCSVPVVIGTAPVNMAANPAAAVNVPILANSADEAIEALGYIADFKNYSLCQMMYLTSNVYQVSPVVTLTYWIRQNTTNHSLKQKSRSMTSGSACSRRRHSRRPLSKSRSRRHSLVKGTDYDLEFNEDGHLVISLIGTGAGKSAISLKVSGKQLDPSKVTKDDIIGTYSAGKETGMQLIRQVYPKLSIAPGLLIAPAGLRFRKSA